MAELWVCPEVLSFRWPLSGSQQKEYVCASTGWEGQLQGHTVLKGFPLSGAVLLYTGERQLNGLGIQLCSPRLGVQTAVI